MTMPAALPVYVIGGHQSSRELAPEAVGSKAAHLARLDRLGLNVPPALALPAAACRMYLDCGALPDRSILEEAMRLLQRATGLSFGGSQPLLVSVRSSPPASMPGMLGTILNVGINEDTVRGLIRRTGNPWLAWDVYRRFARSYAEARAGVHDERFDRIAAEHFARAGAEGWHDLDAIALRDVARAFASLLPSVTHATLPADPLEQLTDAIEAVFSSWTSPQAREYRRLNGLDDRTGTALLIQTMVFGNSGWRSGSGAAFTRNPATGDPPLYADFLFNAQGEDLVAGRLPVLESALPAALPQVWAQLMAVASALEREFGDLQDFEFTVDNGQLYILQTRAGKRTPWAAVRIAADLVREGLLDPPRALERLQPYDLDANVRVAVRPRPGDRPLAQATPASIGAASGRVVFDAGRARALAADGPVILLRHDLTTDDVAAVAVSAGVVTARGGRTSHAAVVARQLARVCLVGCSALQIDETARSCRIGAESLDERDVVTIDGDTGCIYRGEVPVIAERPFEDLALIAQWRADTMPASTR